MVYSVLNGSVSFAPFVSTQSIFVCMLLILCSPLSEFLELAKLKLSFWTCCVANVTWSANVKHKISTKRSRKLQNKLEKPVILTFQWTLCFANLKCSILFAGYEVLCLGCLCQLTDIRSTKAKPHAKWFSIIYRVTAAPPFDEKLS